MSAKEIFQKLLDAFNRHDSDSLSKFYAENASAYDPQYIEPLRGREAIRKDFEDFFASFPDIKLKANKILESGGVLAVESEFSGTNRGPLQTPTGAQPATNQKVRMTGAQFLRVNEKDQIVEERRYYDIATLLRQLGVEELSLNQA